MRAEKHSMIINKFYDDENNPTCATNFNDPANYVCCFYRTQSFGTREKCVFSDGDLLNRRERKDGIIGTLIPDKDCPIWGETSVHISDLPVVSKIPYPPK